MDYESDPDKLKVLRDKLFKLRSEMTRNNKKKKMMKGFLNQRDNFLSQEIEVVKDNLDTTIDSKIDELNDRVNNDIMKNAKLDNDCSNAEYIENEHVHAYKGYGDDVINETARSEASINDSLGKVNNNEESDQVIKKNDSNN